MTETASPGQPNDGPEGGASDGGADLARFVQDWTALWQREMRGQASETGPGPATDPWRAAMTLWADPLTGEPATAAPAGERTATSRTQAAAVAPDTRDAEIRRLAGRVDELEARLAKLETNRRRRG